MQVALRHGGRRASLHYVSTSVGNGVTTTIVGDVNQTAGTQTVVVSTERVKVSVVIELVGHEAYFRGSAAAVEIVIELTAREAAALLTNGSQSYRRTRSTRRRRLPSRSAR